MVSAVSLKHIRMSPFLLVSSSWFFKTLLDSLCGNTGSRSSYAVSWRRNIQAKWMEDRSVEHVAAKEPRNWRLGKHSCTPVTASSAQDAQRRTTQDVQVATHTKTLIWVWVCTQKWDGEFWKLPKYAVPWVFNYWPIAIMICLRFLSLFPFVWLPYNLQCMSACPHLRHTHTHII